MHTSREQVDNNKPHKYVQMADEQDDVEEPALFAYDWLVENFPHTYEEFCHQPRRGPYGSDKIEVRANNVASSIGVVPKVSGNLTGGENAEDTSNALYGIWKMRLLCRGHPEPLGPSGTVPMQSQSLDADQHGTSPSGERNDDDDDESDSDENNDDDDNIVHYDANQHSERAGYTGGTVGAAVATSKPQSTKKRKHHRRREPYPLLVTLKAVKLDEPVEAFVRLSLIDSNEQIVYGTRVRTKPHRFKESVAAPTEFELRVTKEELFSMPSPAPPATTALPTNDAANHKSPSRAKPSSAVASSAQNRNEPTSSATGSFKTASGKRLAKQDPSPAAPSPPGVELPTFPPPVRSVVDGTPKPMKYFHKHRTLRIRLELQIHPGTLWSPLHDDMLRLFTDEEEHPDAEAAVLPDFRVIVGRTSTPPPHGSSSGGGGGLKSATPSRMHMHASHAVIPTLYNNNSGRVAAHAQQRTPPSSDSSSSSSSVHSSHSSSKFVKSFRCHRLVLASRCPFFAAMLSNKKFRETSRGEHHIDNVRPSVVRVILQFIYTDFTAVIGLDFDAAYELYSLAREYELKRLLELCKYRMVQCVNAQNCLAAFRIGDLHDESVIKRVAIATVARQKHAVTSSPSWADIMHNEPTLLGKMLVEMAPMVGSLFSGPGSGLVVNRTYSFGRIGGGGVDPFGFQQHNNMPPHHQTIAASIAPVVAAAAHSALAVDNDNSSSSTSSVASVSSNFLLANRTGEASSSSQQQQSSRVSRGGRSRSTTNNKRRRIE